MLVETFFLKKLGNRERDKKNKTTKTKETKKRKSISSNEKTFDQTVVSIRSERKKNTLQLERYDRFRRYDKHREGKEKFSS